MIILRQKAFSDNPGQKEFNSKAAKALNNKYLASYVKPGMSVPKSKVREYLRTKTPEINSSNDMVNWGINIKAARSSNISSARSTHLGYNNEPRRFKKSMWLNNPESQKLYDHGNGKNLTGKHKETMKFVRETINKNK